MDEPAQWACTDFARGFKAAQTRQARVDLANKVTKWSSRSSNILIEESGARLARVAEDPDDVWKLAADLFAANCFDAGWTGD